MRTTMTFDDTLVADIQEMTGIDDRADAIRMAMAKYVEYEAARQLKALGGSQPGFVSAPRRRSSQHVNPE